MKAEDKVKIVLEGLGSENNVSKICDKYRISRQTFYNWKNDLIDGATERFKSKKPGRKKQEKFASKEEAEAALESMKKEIQALKKEKEGLEIQRDFAKFRLKLRTDEEEKKTSKQKKKNGS